MTSQRTLGWGKVALAPSKAGRPRSLGTSRWQPRTQGNQRGHRPGTEQLPKQPDGLTSSRPRPWEPGSVWGRAPSPKRLGSGLRAGQTLDSLGRPGASPPLCVGVAWPLRLAASPGSRFPPAAPRPLASLAGLMTGSLSVRTWRVTAIWRRPWTTHRHHTPRHPVSPLRSL